MCLYVCVGVGGDAPIRICVCVRLYVCMCAREACAFVCGGGGGKGRCWVSSCASLASFFCTTISLLRYTSRHSRPSLLSLSAHRVTSDGVSPLQPHVPLPPVPPRPPRDQQGNLVLQRGDCCLLILQRLCTPVFKLWGGGLVCVSVCVCARPVMHAVTGGCGRTLHTPTHADIHTAVHVHAGTRRRPPDSL